MNTNFELKLFFLKISFQSSNGFHFLLAVGALIFASLNRKAQMCVLWKSYRNKQTASYTNIHNLIDKYLTIINYIYIHIPSASGLSAIFYSIPLAVLSEHNSDWPMSHENKRDKIASWIRSIEINITNKNQRNYQLVCDKYSLRKIGEYLAWIYKLHRVSIRKDKFRKMTENWTNLLFFVGKSQIKSL